MWCSLECGKRRPWIVKNEECGVACVAGVRKGRGREFGRETAREGEGRRGQSGRYPFPDI